MNRRTYPIHPVEMVATLMRNRDLVLQMTRRDIIGRYRGSVVGLLWSFVNPILMLSVYTFVFGVVLNARWGVDTGSKTEFATVLFAGLIVHSLFAECANRAPGLIVQNVNYVKKVVFPLEILPWVGMGSALFHAAMSVVVLFLFLLVLHFALPWTAVFLPLVLLPLVVFTMGVTWFLAAFGVYVRDVSQIVGILTTVLLFLSPIFYPASALPEGLRPYIFLNPLSFIIEQVRAVVIWGAWPDWSGLALYLALSALVAWLGFLWFQKTRRGFADVL